MGWPFPMLKYKYIFQIKYTEAILSNSTPGIVMVLNYQTADCSLKINLLIIIFRTLSFPTADTQTA